MALKSYRIVIPSRNRLGNISNILSLLPTATVLVHHSEYVAYRDAIGAQKVVDHGVTGIAAIRNYALRTFTEDCIIFCDDDLKWMWCMTGQRQRKITDPGAILQVLENAINTSVDLGIELFSFSRNRDPLQYFANKPFNMTGPACGMFGVIGRTCRFDERLEWGEDLDLTLQYLLTNRVTLHDFRYYFDFGGVGEGVGGLQGIRTSDGRSRSVKILADKCGRKYLNIEKRLLETQGMSIRVNRKAKIISQK